MLTTPSPSMKPEASTISDVLDHPLRPQYQVKSPPIARANVNDGTLYMPDFESACRLPP